MSGAILAVGNLQRPLARLRLRARYERGDYARAWGAHSQDETTPQELENYFVRAGFKDIVTRREQCWVFVNGTKP